MVLACFLSIYDYSSFADWVLLQFDKPHLKAKFQQIFPTPRYTLIQYGIWFLVGATGLGIFYLIHKAKAITEKLGKVIKKVILFCNKGLKVLESLSFSEKLLLLGIIGGSGLLTLYRIFTLDFIYDEVWTFLYFTRHPPFIAISTYPAPNNHVLFSFISSILYNLGFSSLWALRLPVFLTGSLTSLLFWFFTKEYFGKTTAFISLSFFAFCLPFSFYSVYGRGYIFIILFTLIAIWALLKLMEAPKNNYYFITLLGAIVLGFYSIPTFLYVYILLLMFVLFFSFKTKEIQVFLAFFKVSCWAAIGVVVLYSPILMVYGVRDALLKNTSQLVIQDSLELLHGFPEYINEVVGFWGGNKYIGWLIGIGIIIWAVVYARNVGMAMKKNIAALSGIGLLLPLLFYFIQGVKIPARVWSFEILFLALFLGDRFSTVLRKINSDGDFIHPKKSWVLKDILKAKLLFCSCLIVVGLTGYLTYTNPFWRKLKQGTKNLSHLASLINEQNFQNCFLNYYIIKPYLEYETYKSDQTLELFMAQKGSVDYHPLKIEDKFDGLVIGKNNQYTENLDIDVSFWKKYQLIYQDDSVEIYRLIVVNH